MLSATLYIIMLSIAIIILLLMAISSTLSAFDTYNSPNYIDDTNLRSSTEYSSIAAGLIWAVLTIIIIILIYVYFSDTLRSFYTDYTNDLLTHTSDYVIFVLMTIIIIAILTATVASALSVSYLSATTNRDAATQSAFIASIISLISGFVLIVITIVAVIIYIIHSRSRIDTVSNMYTVIWSSRLNWPL